MQVQFIAKVSQPATEGLLQDIPIGIHKISIPISKMAFIDTKGGVNTLGGSFTSSTVEQIITDGVTIDGVSYFDIVILPYE